MSESNAHYRMLDHKEWDAAGLDKVMERHEMEFVNQEWDMPEQLRGDWFITDDETRTIIYGSFGHDHCPGASGTTYADVWPDDEDGRLEYEQAKAEWEAKPEYLDTDDEDGIEEDMVECIECGNAFCTDDMITTDAGDHICEDCLEEMLAREMENNPEPSDDDLVTKDGVNFYVVGPRHTLAFRVEPNRSVRAAYNQYVTDEGGNFYPSVYMEEERGGWHVFNMEAEEAVWLEEHDTDDIEEESDVETF